MNRSSWISTFGLVCVLMVTLAGCGGGEEADTGQDDALAGILEQKSALDAKRAEIAALAEQMAAAPVEGEEAEGETASEGEDVAAVDAEADPEAQLAQLKAEEADLSEEYMTAIVMFLNNAGMVADEAPSGPVLEAIRLKSDEDMLIAQDYIDKGGDYRRALEILDTALMLDPDNTELKGMRDQIEVDQYMTEERFAMVSKGMTQADVKSRLGTPNPHNVREYEDRNVTAWFYRREDKGAAGVWFEEKDGEQVVYRLDFDAIQAEGEDE